MSQAQVKATTFEGEPCLELKGQWDHGVLDGLIKAFQKNVSKTGHSLFVRMADVEYMDSAALGVLMFNMRELAKRNAKMILLQPSFEIMQILHTASLDKVLEIRPA